eukprot:365778-Chlamydomonas_euryale.AAC.21
MPPGSVNVSLSWSTAGRCGCELVLEYRSTPQSDQILDAADNPCTPRLFTLCRPDPPPPHTHLTPSTWYSSTQHSRPLRSLLRIAPTHTATSPPPHTPEPIHVVLLYPVLEAVDDELAHRWLVAVEGVAAAAVVVVLATACKHVIYAIVEAAHGKCGALLVALCRVVEHHVQDDLDASLVALAHQRLQSVFVLFVAFAEELVGHNGSSSRSVWRRTVVQSTGDTRAPSALNPEPRTLNPDPETKY